MSTSYTQLYNYIKSASENDDTEFADAIPTFIDQTRMRARPRSWRRRS